MPETEYTMIYLTRSVLLVENILFLYVFLTPGRKRIYQAAVLAATWIVTNIIRHYLLKSSFDPLLLSYLVGLSYIIPCIFIFKETIQAKIFIFFMIFSFSLSSCLVFTHIDLFLTPVVRQTYVLAGMIIEVAMLPLIYRYARSPIRSILEIIDLQNPVFILFPVLSFFLLAVYGLQREYHLSTFITLLLSTTLIFFSYFLIAISISGTRRLNELELLSMTDSLTGLYNRRFMEKKLGQEFQKYIRTGAGFAIASADIDFFKNVNDIYGHDCGDSLLKSVADIMLGSVRAYDIVARWGGEEFLLLFPSASEQNAVELSERIRRRFEAGRYITADRNAVVTLTLGVSVIRPSETVESLIKRADIALYHGKNKGRNRVISYNDIEPA